MNDCGYKCLRGRVVLGCWSGVCRKRYSFRRWDEIEGHRFRLFRSHQRGEDAVDVNGDAVLNKQ